MEAIDNNLLTVVDKYNKLHESRKRANAKYRINNPEKFRDISKNYYERNKGNEEFMRKKREYAKAYYLKKKNQKHELEEN